MPASATEPGAGAVKEKRQDAFGRRKETALRAELDAVSTTLAGARAMADGERGVGACWPTPLEDNWMEATLQATMAETGGLGTRRLRPSRWGLPHAGCPPRHPHAF